MKALADFIIRPYRESYSLNDLRPMSFTLNQKKYQRKDIEVLGLRGMLKCSWYEEGGCMSGTCVVYCHGNSGSRVDSEEILELVLRMGMSLFCFDFAGCGMSEGEYVTLGMMEKDDISAVVRFLYSERPSGNIVLWGRSMGAVASIIYTKENPHITAMILDSPFANFPEVADELVAEYKIPKFLRQYLLTLASGYIKTSIGFDINHLIPKNFIKTCKIPTIFIHSQDDKLVNIKHSKELYEIIKGPKCFIEITGDHNTVRDKSVVYKALKIVDFFIEKRRIDPFEMNTSRDNLPEFRPKLVEIIRHRRVHSHGHAQNPINT